MSLDSNSIKGFVSGFKFYSFCKQNVLSQALVTLVKQLSYSDFLMFFSSTKTYFRLLLTKVYRFNFHVIRLALTLSETVFILWSRITSKLCVLLLFSFLNNALFFFSSPPLPLSLL